MEGRFKHRKLIHTFKDQIIRIQHTRPYFVQWGPDPNCYTFLARYLHQLCGHVFRVDVFTAIKNGLAAEYHDDALAGAIPLCYDAVWSALDPDTPSKMKIAHAAQNRLRRWRDRWHALWGPDHETPKPYRHKPYRRVYFLAMEIIQATMGPRQARLWSRDFQTFIRSTGCILPYPGNQRMVYVVGQVYKWWSSSPKELQRYLTREAASDPLSIGDVRWDSYCSTRR